MARMTRMARTARTARMARMARMARWLAWLADSHGSLARRLSLPNFTSILIAVPFVFSPPFSEHRLQEYSKCRAYQTLLKITHR